MQQSITAGKRHERACSDCRRLGRPCAESRTSCVCTRANAPPSPEAPPRPAPSLTRAVHWYPSQDRAHVPLDACSNARPWEPSRSLASEPSNADDAPCLHQIGTHASTHNLAQRGSEEGTELAALIASALPLYGVATGSSVDARVCPRCSRCASPRFVAPPPTAVPSTIYHAARGSRVGGADAPSGENAPSSDLQRRRCCQQ